jgi:lysophospholipase L1-like esterase
MTPARGRALAVLLGLGLLAGVEGGLRLAGYTHEVAAVNFRFVGPDVLNMPEYVRDRRLFWRLKPGGPEIGVAVPGVTGATGFRGPVVLKQRTPGGVRVACMGDSTTYGVGMPLEQTYVALLGRALEHALQRPVEMVNAGCPGYSSYQGLRLLESDVVPLQPDVVTLLFGAWNDFTPAIGGDDEAKGSRWRMPAWTDRFVAGVRDQRLFMLVAHGHEVLLGSTPDPRFGQRRLDEYLKGFAAGRPPEGERVPPEKFAANLRRMVAVARARGIVPVLVTPPLSQESQREHPVFMLYRDAVHEVAGMDGVAPDPRVRGPGGAREVGREHFHGPHPSQPRRPRDHGSPGGTDPHPAPAPAHRPREPVISSVDSKVSPRRRK